MGWRREMATRGCREVKRSVGIHCVVAKEESKFNWWIFCSLESWDSTIFYFARVSYSYPARPVALVAWDIKVIINAIMIL
jgi:hypothetical protein